MKYRIKITTFNTGRKEHTPYVKKGWFWKGVGYEGDETNFPCHYAQREGALRVIDLHFAGNVKVQSIDFEYITK